MVKEKQENKKAGKEKAPKTEEEGKISKKTVGCLAWQELIYAYALENAVSHEAKAKPEAVLSHLFKEGLKREEIKEVMPLIQKTVEKINLLSRQEQEKEFSKNENLVKKPEEQKEKQLPELKNAKQGAVVLRLAPYPSGALHIGNAKTYLLNALYAEKYQGKTLLIIDDTIGSKDKGIVKEAYDLIPDAFDWLKVNYEKPIIYKSDRLELYYKYAKELIRKDKAYVCFCDKEKLRKNREKGIACSCRKTKEGSQKNFKEMFKLKPGEAVLRLKTDIKHPNPAFRDRVLFRISDAWHPRKKNKIRVWPMLEFSWAVDDVLLGITHVIRGKDLMIESEMEKYIWDILGWKGPELIHAGLVSIEGAKISKSKAQREVKNKEYIGWDDPRTWSIQSLRRRGIQPEAIKEFVKEIGLNQKDITIPIEALYAINRKMLDKDTDRYSFVAEPIKLLLDKIPVKKIQAKVHPDKEEKREILIGKDIYIAKKDFEKFKGNEIRLMHLFNIKLDKECKNQDKNIKEKQQECKAAFTSIENKDVPKVHWVSESVKARVLMPDGKWIEGLAEKAVENLNQGTIIQFERQFFCRFDRKTKQSNKEQGKEGKQDKEGIYEFWFSHG